MVVKWQKEKIKNVEVIKRYHPAIQIKFHYRTVPEMMFQQEYQRAPIHVGKSVINFNAYVLTEDDIKKYQEQEDKDTVDLIVSMNASLEALREDLDKYLKEAGEITEIKEEEAKEPSFFQKMLEPFTSIIIGIFGKKKAEEETKVKIEKAPTWKEKLEKAKLIKDSSKTLWLVYDSFKKSNGMTCW